MSGQRHLDDNRRRARRPRWVDFAAATTTAVALTLPVGTSAEALPGTENTTTRISVSALGEEAVGVGFDDAGYGAEISADGRFIAYLSTSAGIVPGVVGGASRDQVLVYDTALGTTIHASPALGGGRSDGRASQVALSADGRFVAFRSDATDLVPGDTNVANDVFVRDVVLGTTTRVSVDSAGNQGDDHSSRPSISGDGRYVAFTSLATDLVPGDTNGFSDVFLHDTKNGSTTRVSVDSAGAEGTGSSSGPTISADGRLVAFHSTADDLVAGDFNFFADVFVHDTVSATTSRISLNSADGQVFGGDSFDASLSAAGDLVAFVSGSAGLVPNDLNATFDVFVRDLTTGTTARVSVATDGTEADSRSLRPRLSADGRHVVFDSDATNLVSDDTNGASDAFAHDTATGTTERVSVRDDGGQSSGKWPSISGDGRLVTFDSTASDLVPGDRNGNADVFLRGVSVPVCGVVAATITGAGAITGTPGDDVIYGSPGVDVIDAGGGDDIVCAGAGDDVIDGGPGNDQLLGQAGSDTITGRLGDDIIFGGPGGDILNGNFDDDSIDGGEGNDILSGNFGDDRLFGGGDDDILFGSDGPDVLDGGPGHDSLFGEAGDDRFWHSSGDDNYNGGFDSDTVDYSHATQRILATVNFNPDDGPLSESDQIAFSTENIIATAFDDIIIGSDRDNVISTLAGDDIVLAEEGNDTVLLGPGNDRVRAGKGDDTIDAGIELAPTTDVCTGGPGTDTQQRCDVTFSIP